MNNLRQVLLGYVDVNSANIVLGDPGFVGRIDDQTYETCVPQGRWPVYADTVDFGEEGGWRIGRVLVVFDEDLMARPDYVDREMMGEVGVDSGILSFADAELAKQAQLVGFEQRIFDEFKSRFLDSGYGWAQAPIEAGGAAEAVAFSSGFGDGTYSIWLWFDPELLETDEVAALGAIGVVTVEELLPFLVPWTREPNTD